MATKISEMTLRSSWGANTLIEIADPDASPKTGSVLLNQVARSAANPSASVGLTAVNGSASTFMRSDGAPALSQAIVPTWSGLHTFTAGLTFSGGTLLLSGAGTPGAGKVLTSDGSGAATWGAGVPSGANPTASLGLAAVNGSASTFMRSDAAPALDQAIVPTWSGLHTFSGGLTLSTGTFSLYGTGFGTANYERLTISHAGSSTGIRFISEKGGSGTFRPFKFMADTLQALFINENGVTAFGANSTDVGFSVDKVNGAELKSKTALGDVDTFGNGPRFLISHGSSIPSATNGNQKTSPAFNFRAFGWDETGGGAAATGTIGAYLQPTQVASSVPQYDLIWKGSYTGGPGSGTISLRLNAKGGVVIGPSGTLATSVVDGFLYIPSCAGTPTGTPTAYTGKIPFIYDSTNDYLYVYNGGAWKKTTQFA